MDRRDWLTLLLAYKGAHGPALDPVRIQKGMFLFAQEAGAPEAEVYDFEAYNYGPYSSELKSDVSGLVASGLAEEIPVSGYTWARHGVTDEGMTRARALFAEAPTEPARELYKIKQEITSLGFSELLRRIYKKYPAYAENSIFL